MSFQSGHKLAHYEILEPIGRGGMGEVYRAKDGKLGRDVAIKVLPDEFAQDEERLRRFQREAKVLASLNHPNIASIYGLEQSGDTHYLVLELVPGETLAERIARGPIPIDEALEIATKIAEALEEAHEGGIVHRDLKPANVKLTEDGKVKVLDFGLARAFADEDSELSPATSMSPTITRDATRVGVILGTAAYMSPEQAKGRRVDKRTDIFAFGVVVYEMLSGKKAFPGDDVSEVLAAVINLDPEWSAVSPDLDPRITNLVRRCLRKDGKKRLRDIGDVRNEIAEIISEPSVAKRPIVDSTPNRALWGLSMLVAALVAALAVWAVLGRETDAGPRTTRLEVYLEEPIDLTADFAFSPDGSSLVYASGAGTSSQLFVRNLDAYESRPIPNTEGGYFPFFSPDGQWVGFFANGTLERISLQGGGRSTLADSRGLRGARWLDDGDVLVAGRGGIRRVSEDGDDTVSLVAGDDLIKPDLLPRGAGLLFTVPSAGTSRIAVLAGDGGDWRILDALGEATTPRYLPTGHLLFGARGTLHAVPFDLSRLEVAGIPTPVVEGVASRSNFVYGEELFFAVSDTGDLAYVPGATADQRQLVWVDRYGRESVARAELGPYEYPTVSPDGTRIAYARHDARHDSWVYHVEQRTDARLTNGQGTGNVWRPGGQAIVLGAAGQPPKLYLRDVEGRGQFQPLANVTPAARPGTWTPDGHEHVYVAAEDAGGNHDLWVWREGDETQRILDSEADEYQPALSPDGRFLAYVSNESGSEEVYVQPYPGLEWRRLVSRDGGREPRWSPDGDELYYRRDGAVFNVPIRSEPVFSAGTPELLFEGNYLIHFPGNTSLPNYDVSPDGERFLMIRNEEPQRRIRIVLNWFDELERLVPTDD